MIPVAASDWVADRLARARREAGAPRGIPGERAARRRPTGCPARPDGGRLTLEQRLDSVWEGLRAEGAAACPVCGGSMQGSGPATCAGCGSQLY